VAKKWHSAGFLRSFSCSYTALPSNPRNELLGRNRPSVLNEIDKSIPDSDEKQ
jgi:hypothetical protein